MTIVACFPSDEPSQPTAMDLKLAAKGNRKIDKACDALHDELFRAEIVTE